MKKIFLFLVAVLLSAVMTYNISVSRNNFNFDVALENIEALAQGEDGGWIHNECHTYKKELYVVDLVWDPEKWDYVITIVGTMLKKTCESSGGVSCEEGAVITWNDGSQTGEYTSYQCTGK